MKKDTEKTDVIFRKHKKGGGILAVFPHTVDHYRGDVRCYEHVGQHSAGDYLTCIKLTRPSDPVEYADLKKELETAFGYNLRVIKRQNRNEFYKSYHEANRRNRV